MASTASALLASTREGILIRLKKRAIIHNQYQIQHELR